MAEKKRDWRPNWSGDMDPDFPPEEVRQVRRDEDDAGEDVAAAAAKEDWEIADHPTQPERPLSRRADEKYEGVFAGAARRRMAPRE